MAESSMNTLVFPSSIRVLVTAAIMLCTMTCAVDVKIVDDAVVQKALQATVVINTYTGPETGHMTLGYFASADGLVVTSAAGLEGAQKVSLYLADGRNIDDAKFLGMDERKRVAVLATNRKPPAFLELYDSAPGVGDACAVIGMRQADKLLQAASGQLLARRLALNQPQTQFVDTWSIGARYDCSVNGGVVVNTSGHVVGLFERGEVMQSQQWFKWAVPQADIQAALKKAWQTKKPAPFPRLGEVTPSLASLAQSDPDYLKGVESMRQGDYPAAIEKFTNTLRRYPKDPQSLSDLAGCYSSNRDLENASKCLDELTQAGVNLWMNRVGIAAMMSNAGNYTAASEHLKAVLKKEPRLGNAWTLHAKVLRNLGRKHEALAAARRGAELEPDYVRSWTTLSDILLDLGDLTAYREAQDRADTLESLLFKLDHLPLRGLKGN